MTVGHLTLGAIHNRVDVVRRVAADPRIELTALYESVAGIGSGEFGYGQDIEWDSDLLSGYESVFAKRAGRDRLLQSWRMLDPDLLALIARRRFDVLWIHAYVYPTHMLAGMLQRALGGGLVLRETQTILPREQLQAASGRDRVKRGLIRAAFGRRSVGAYVGTASKRWFRRYGFADERLRFTPNEVDVGPIARECERVRKDGDPRARFGLPGTGAVVLWVGRFVDFKQPHLLLDAFAEIRRQRECSLLMAGSGPLQAEIEERVRVERIPGVHFAGFLNRGEIAQAYAAADLFVLPSTRLETFGLVVNEALACGLPAIVSDGVGCAEDLVLEGENGYVVPQTEAAPLANAIARLVDDADLRARMGERSRAVIADWTTDRTVAGIIDAIGAAAGPERWEAAR